MGGGFGGGLVPSKFNVSVSYSDKKPNVGKPVRHSDKASVVFGKYVKPEKWDIFNILKLLYFISFLGFHLREKEINGLLGTKNWNKLKMCSVNSDCDMRGECCNQSSICSNDFYNCMTSDGKLANGQNCNESKDCASGCCSNSGNFCTNKSN